MSVHCIRHDGCRISSTSVFRHDGASSKGCLYQKDVFKRGWTPEVGKTKRLTSTAAFLRDGWCALPSGPQPTFPFSVFNKNKTNPNGSALPCVKPQGNQLKKAIERRSSFNILRHACVRPQHGCDTPIALPSIPSQQNNQTR